MSDAGVSIPITVQEPNLVPTLRNASPSGGSGDNQRVFVPCQNYTGN
eukprot:CAMPEP_0171324770 /NCGR_PEP_ID=MMETSP0816-20121228/116398_1 /TAXON_ID=420281 /ORGANISM="Proboscia inermis, Strain CCAP1064/1" /LENGTH=46 /DNA_ID= /DNA_START= /DNA_END= /DNA_ORIENTATION=